MSVDPLTPAAGAALERIQSLEQRVAELDRFGYTIAHELRGPLHVIGGFARALELNDAQGLSAKGRDRLRRIVESVDHMDRLIDGMLAFARAEQVSVCAVPVALDELARDVLRELRPAYRRTRVVVGELPLVQADPALARQVLANLLGNALKFSALAQQPLVELASCGADPSVLVLRDNGVGFDARQAQALFTPFERLHGDPAYPGTGVGLAIVKRLLERHGGWIEADSCEGGPTTIRFSFEPRRGGAGA